MAATTKKSIAQFAVVVVALAAIIYEIVVLVTTGPLAVAFDVLDVLVPDPFRNFTIWIIWLIWTGGLIQQVGWFRRQRMAVCVLTAAAASRLVALAADWPPLWPWAYFLCLSAVPYLAWRNWHWVKYAQAQGWGVTFRQVRTWLQWPGVRVVAREFWASLREKGHTPQPPEPTLTPPPPAIHGCAHCGSAMEPGWACCPSCGTLAGEVGPPQRCERCDLPQEAGWACCPSCGPAEAAPPQPLAGQEMEENPYV